MSPIIGLNDNRLSLARTQHNVHTQINQEEAIKDYIVGLRRELHNLRHAISELQETQNQSDPCNPYVLVSTTECLEFIRCHNILRLEADGNYTYIYHRNGQKYTASKSLKHFADILPRSSFLRSHQSHIVNINAIVKYSRMDGGQIILENDKEIPVSRNKRNEIISHFKAMAV